MELEPLEQLLGLSCCGGVTGTCCHVLGLFCACSSSDSGFKTLFSLPGCNGLAQ